MEEVSGAGFVRLLNSILGPKDGRLFPICCGGFSSIKHTGMEPDLGFVSLLQPEEPIVARQWRRGQALKLFCGGERVSRTGDFLGQ